MHIGRNSIWEVFFDASWYCLSKLFSTIFDNFDMEIILNGRQIQFEKKMRSKHTRLPPDTVLSRRVCWNSREAFKFRLLSAARLLNPPRSSRWRAARHWALSVPYSRLPNNCFSDPTASKAPPKSLSIQHGSPQSVSKQCFSDSIVSQLSQNLFKSCSQKSRNSAFFHATHVFETGS